MTIKTEACWVDGTPPTRYRSLTSTIRTDAVVIGAGIVGLTVAYALAARGVAVTVLEARRIARGATARSTAKVTSQHGLALCGIADEHDEKLTRLYADANVAGAASIVDTARELGLDCDLETRAAYAYATDAQRRSDLAREVELARRCGIAAELVERAPLPFDNAGAVVYPAQAQFNPVKYLVGLAAAVRAAGGRICEHARATKAEREGGEWTVSVDKHRVHASHVVMACHLPFESPVPYDAITTPRCHAAMAFDAPADAIDGMFIGIDDPTHSLRMGRDERGPLLVVLAPKVPTGHDGDLAARFDMLERWVRRHVPSAGEARWRWINEDYDSPDRIPYAGALTKEKGLYVATGFGGWGLSNGAAAGLMIAAQVEGKEHPWSALYAPERAAKKANKGGDTQTPLLHVRDLRPNQGGVITRGKDKIGVWRSGSGRLHAVSASCTHKGCTVTWSNADSTWQCPCHGSIFAADGKVLHGPATEPLAPAQVPQD